MNEMFRLADPALYEGMEGDEWNKTAMHDGEVLACGGLLPLWPDNEMRAVAWMHLGMSRPEFFTFIHKQVMKVLVESPYKRIEAFTDPTFPLAARWIKLLGFKNETPFKPFYFPDGRAAQEWVRIR